MSETEEPRTAVGQALVASTAFWPKGAPTREQIREAVLAIEEQAGRIDEERLAWALADMTVEEVKDMYGRGHDPRDVPEEWWNTPREMAEYIAGRYAGVSVEQMTFSTKEDLLAHLEREG